MAQPSAPARVPSFPADHDPAAIAAAFDEAGCVVLTGAMPAAARAQLRAEMAAVMDTAAVQDDDPAAFYPGHTRRAVALVTRSLAARDLVMHPASLALGQHHLGANCLHFQLHATAAVEIGPGARDQVLHREEDPFNHFPLPRPNLVLASIWAVSEFTAANGATRVVPGSHRWPAGRVPTADEIAIGEMPAGSVLYWAGGLLHGGGANTTADGWRYGVILTYSCGWLRQEENQYLEVSREVLAEFDAPLRKVVGFGMHGALGYRDPRL